MLDSAIQHYWKLVVERLYHTVQQDAVGAIRRLPDGWRRVLRFGGDYF